MGGAPDAPDLLEGVLKLIIGRIMQGAHRLERNNVRTLGGVEDLLGSRRFEQKDFSTSTCLPALMSASA